MNDPVTRAIVIRAPIREVWAALVHPAQMSSWFGADVELEPRPGGAVRFFWADGTERRGVVVDVDPPRRLSFRWRELRSRPRGTTVSDPGVVVFELDSDGGGTRVVVTESPGVVPFQAGAPLAEARS